MKATFATRRHRSDTTCQPILACNTYCYDPAADLKAALYIRGNAHIPQRRETRVTAPVRCSDKIKEQGIYLDKVTGSWDGSRSNGMALREDL